MRKVPEKPSVKTQDAKPKKVKAEVSPDTPSKTPAKKQSKTAKKPLPAKGAKPPKGRRGRPKDSPDVWTKEHIEEVADLLWNYIEKTACPNLPEFCYKFGIRRQRLYEFPETIETKEYLHAKRASFFEKEGRALTSKDGSKGAFLIRALGNVGEYSMLDKTETTGTLTTNNTHIYLPSNSRGDGPKVDGEDA